MRTVISVMAAAFLVAAQAPAAVRQAPAAGVWRAFEGTWVASGQTQTVQTESGQPAATFRLSGAVSLSAGEGLSAGFRGEAIGFTDAGVGTGRAVWSDERSDRIFSALKGEALESGRRVTATITGGTGRYAGIAGDYTFEWQYVVSAEGGTISGRAIGLRGRVRGGTLP